MKLIPGAVTPLGILNDAEHRVQVFMDVEFVGNKIGVHPNDNTDRKSTRLNSSHMPKSRMPSSA